MEISYISENELQMVSCTQSEASWNSRTIKWIDQGDKISSVITPFMQKMQGEISGGYNEEVGGYIEGKISFSIGDVSRPTSEPKKEDSQRDIKEKDE